MNIAEILGISSVSDVNVTNQTENVENTNEDFALSECIHHDDG